MDTARLRKLIRDFFKAFGAKVRKTELGLEVTIPETQDSAKAPAEAPVEAAKAPDATANINEADQSPEDAPKDAPKNVVEDAPKSRIEAAKEARNDPQREQNKDLEALAKAFGKRKLFLAFDQQSLKDHYELVIEGGHILRTIEDFLSHRGQRVYVEYPSKDRLSKSKVSEHFQPKKALSFDISERENNSGFDFYFSFKAQFRGRSRQDRMYSVRVLDRPQQAPEIRESKAPRGIQSWTWKARKQPPRELLQRAHQHACQYIEKIATREAIEFQNDGRQSIQKDILRIKAFYAQQIAELRGNKTPTEKARSRIIDLEEEQARKIKEQLKNTNVEVDVETLQLMIVERPLQRATLTFHKGEVKGQFATVFDRGLGQFAKTTCLGCEKPLQGLDLCNQGHIACQSCFQDCDCGQVRCSLCGPKKCKVCDRPGCTACIGDCPSCTESACLKHAQACSGCKNSSCPDCVIACQGCQKDFCPSCRLGSLDQSLPFCKDCGKPCAVCQDWFAKDSLGRCQTCGRRVCQGCVGGEVCADCQRAEAPA